MDFKLKEKTDAVAALEAEVETLKSSLESTKSELEEKEKALKELEATKTSTLEAVKAEVYGPSVIGVQSFTF